MLNLIGLEIPELSKEKEKSKHSPSFKMEDKVKKTLLEWNTIKDVELYKDLYKLCSDLFNATQHRKLQGVNYYVDHEKDSETGEEYNVQYAEIQNTYLLPMKTRYELHKKLLERVMSNDTTLIYCDNIVVNATAEDEEKLGQLSFFG